MEGEFNNSLPFPGLHRVRQITNVHCGPAVVKMMLSFVGVRVMQKEVMAAAGITEAKLRNYGMVYTEMAKAVNNLAPSCNFWYKSDSSLGELSQVINVFRYPVGVEWQGIFLPEHKDEDDGHYGVITRVDTVGNLISLVDPFYYDGEDRRMGVVEFERRWWDVNMVHDMVTGRFQEVYDRRLMFVVTHAGETFPEELGMSRG